ncbi:MAG: chlorite dismutase family protein [Proteobacteria bacterium]|nr:chlorite dismutase family protein [Pseudomonadota bacterium]
MTTEACAAANPRAFTFLGGVQGAMRVVSQNTLSGPPIAPAARVGMFAGLLTRVPSEAAWTLCGVASNDRYTTRSEKNALVNRQAPIGRPDATSAALILLRKRAEWWAFTQDERRAILEEDSHHIAIGMRYLPAVARRLLHCRDLATQAPFDFIGFLEFSPGDEPAFDTMMTELRATKEWSFMDREIDIRLTKADV